MSELNKIVKVGMYNTSGPIPQHDFSAFKNTSLAATTGLIAATQEQLNEQIKSKLRLEPNAKEIRYLYYEVVSE